MVDNDYYCDDDDDDDDDNDYYCDDDDNYFYCDDDNVGGVNLDFDRDRDHWYTLIYLSIDHHSCRWLLK